MAAIVLGTAQWGLAYGVTNAGGRLTDEALSELVAAANELGIDQLDTAAAYGDAEERIAGAAAGFAVTTKVSGDGDVPVEEQLRASLARLGRDRVQRCLLHDWPSLDGGQRAAAVVGLSRAQQDGLVDAIGISVYTEDDLRRAEPFADELSVAQVPVNILDQRLDGSGVLDVLRASGWTVQARSVLLQGVLAAPGGTAFRDHPDVRAVEVRATESGVSLMALALAFVSSRSWIDEVVLGVTSAGELRQIAAALSDSSHLQLPDWTCLSSDDLDLIDPRRWPRVAFRT